MYANNLLSITGKHLLILILINYCSCIIILILICYLISTCHTCLLKRGGTL
ncbi:hypothetical protein Hanom_Chr12g01128641 [Helianthus anomalus]